MDDPDNERFETAWRRRFEAFAGACDDDAGIAGWSSSGLDARLRNFARRCAPRRAGARWLDAGCGAGTYTRFLADGSIQVVGVDYSLPSLAKARSRSAGPIVWIAADATRLPLRANAFDDVICFGVTQALAMSKPLVDELAGVVASNGELWIDGLNAWCLPHLWERVARRVQGRPTHTRYEYPHRLRALLGRAGLRDVSMHWLPILPARFAKYQWIVESAPVRGLLAAIPPLGALLSRAFVVRGIKPA